MDFLGFCHNPSPSPKSKVERTWSDSILLCHPPYLRLCHTISPPVPTHTNFSQQPDIQLSSNFHSRLTWPILNDFRTFLFWIVTKSSQTLFNFFSYIFFDTFPGWSWVVSERGQERVEKLGGLQWRGLFEIFSIHWPQLTHVEVTWVNVSDASSSQTHYLLIIIQTHL